MKCSKCKKDLPKSHFNKWNKVSRGYQYYCKECNRKGRAKYYCSETNSRYKKRHKYNLSEEDLDVLESVSNCDICGNEVLWSPSERSKKAYIDHCHDTGEVRGVLCMHCNTSIGKLGDDIESIEHVLNYMKNSPGICRE